MEVSLPANTVGKLFTWTKTESEFWQPLTSVPLTMNVWEESGTKEELLLIPPDHKYNTPPVAFRVILSP
jgi:hypothetical protein